MAKDDVVGTEEKVQKSNTKIKKSNKKSEPKHARDFLNMSDENVVTQVIADIKLHYLVKQIMIIEQLHLKVQNTI